MALVVPTYKSRKTETDFTKFRALRPRGRGRMSSSSLLHKAFKAEKNKNAHALKKKKKETQRKEMETKQVKQTSVPIYVKRRLGMGIVVIGRRVKILVHLCLYPRGG